MTEPQAFPRGNGGDFERPLATDESESALPEQFADLEPFLDWAVEPEAARTARKVKASMGEVRAFYAAMMPRLGEVLDYLEQFFGKEMPAPARRLHLLSLSLVGVATLVEIYKRREVVAACDPLRFVLH